jgi:hypothetical protein
MISSTVACDLSLHHIAPQQRIRAAFPARRNLLTNCQAQDISTYRFPLLRATSRQLADCPTNERMACGNGRELRVRRYRACIPADRHVERRADSRHH